MRKTSRWCALLWLLSQLGCSGKTERGLASDAAPGDKPAAGPARPEPHEPEPERAPAPSERRHLLMVVELEPAAHVARTLTARAVELPLPRRRGRPAPEAWRVDVLDASGAVLFTAPVRDTSEVRAEFPDAQGRLVGTRLKQAVASVTLRLPVLARAEKVRLVKVDGPDPETELARVDYPQVGP